MRETPAAQNYLGYEPALDGLRAVGVAAVLSLHAGFFLMPGLNALAPGGWIGVDIFFVLSGFLITRLLADEMRRNGRISLRRFYTRRILRLFPAYAVLLLADLLFSIWVVHDRDIYKAALVSAGYVMNWSRAFNWFPQATLGHTWSLSMEEQFYILWPVLFIVLDRRRPLLWLLAAWAATAIWRNVLVGQGAGAERIYNGFDTHADTLLIGCALALARPAERLREAARRFSFIPIAGLIVLTQYWYARPLVQTLGFSLCGLATAWIILAAMQPGRLRRALSVRPLIYTGRISYALYLWHFPLFMFAPRYLHGPALLLMIPLTYLVAMLSYAVVEKPFLRLKARFEPSEQRARMQKAMLSEPLLEST
ncbi:MAG TPA: acyltransferase [Alphaproteobacteria bacterium]|jgi:peptidoglycan/LPS O-acetylase OafA/YrhL|nr:acyltransferase [Alphaproteobacteria bacterium]